MCATVVEVTPESIVTADGRFVIRSTGGMRLIPREDVEWAESANHYVRLHVGNASYLIRATMEEVVTTLPDGYARIHRSYVVRLDCIREIRHRENGTYTVRLACDRELPVSRNYKRSFRRVLGL